MNKSIRYFALSESLLIKQIIIMYLRGYLQGEKSGNFLLRIFKGESACFQFKTCTSVLVRQA